MLEDAELLEGDNVVVRVLDVVDVKEVEAVLVIKVVELAQLMPDSRQSELLTQAISVQVYG